MGRHPLLKILHGVEDEMPDRHELRDAGAPSPIEPQVFEVLAYLIAQRHRVVTKQELLDHLWPTHFVSDNTLHQRLTAARRAVGDSSHTQSCIKTLRGLGYRFIAPVEEGAEALRDTNKIVAQPTAAASDRTEVSRASLASPPEVERRQLTIMSCTLVDTVTLADQLAPEDLRDIVQAYHHTCSAVIQRYTGHIVRSLGDRLLVYLAIHTPVKMMRSKPSRQH